jgi:hypothetical protein
VPSRSRPRDAYPSSAGRRASGLIARSPFSERSSYEDLLADPSAQLSEICSTLGIEVTPERVAEIVGEHSYGRVPERSKGTGKVVRAARPGGWRENMTRAEKDAMLEIMGPKLDELGYLEPRERRRLSSASLRGRPRAA